MARSDINNAGKSSASSSRTPQRSGDPSSSSSNGDGFDTEWLDDSGNRAKSRSATGGRDQPGSAGGRNQSGQRSEFDSNGDYIGGSDKPTPASLADGLRDAASSTAHVVSEQAKAVAGEVGHELGKTAEENMGRGADAIRGFARAMEAAGGTIEKQSPQLAQAINEWAAKVENISDNLGNRRVNELFETATDFAKKQPAIFLGAAIATGFALARFLKSSAKPKLPATMADSAMSQPGAFREGGYSRNTGLNEAGRSSGNSDFSGR
jgi:hypothetical protein